MHAEAKAAAADADEIQLTFMQKAQALKGALKPAYWQALIVVSLLYFARFDASFITLRARTVSALIFDPLVVAVRGAGTRKAVQYSVLDNDVEPCLHKVCFIANARHIKQATGSSSPYTSLTLLILHQPR